MKKKIFFQKILVFSTDLYYNIIVRDFEKSFNTGGFSYGTF